MYVLGMLTVSLINITKRITDLCGMPAMTNIQKETLTGYVYIIRTDLNRHPNSTYVGSSLLWLSVLFTPLDPK